EICALAISGLVRTPFSTHNSVDSHLELFERVEIKAAIVEQRYWEELRDRMPAEAPGVRLVIVHGEASGGAEPYDRVLAEAEPLHDFPELGPDAHHILRFSSGTTG